MKKLILAATMLVAGAIAHAEQFESVYSFEGVSASEAEDAFEAMFSDPAMDDAGGVTLYAADFGVQEGSMKIVVDYDSLRGACTTHPGSAGVAWLVQVATANAGCGVRSRGNGGCRQRLG